MNADFKVTLKPSKHEFGLSKNDDPEQVCFQIPADKYSYILNILYNILKFSKAN